MGLLQTDDARLDGAGFVAAKLVNIFLLTVQPQLPIKSTIEGTMKTMQIILLIVAGAVFTTQVQAVMYFARPYDPNAAHWLTRDPIGERGGLNLYGFVGNNPISSIDPLGLSCQKCGVKSLRAIDDGWFVQPTWISFRFHVTAKLRTDSPYQASCCKIVQWRQDTTTWNGQLVSADGNQPTDGKLHIDSNPYIPGDDITNPGSQIGSLSGDTITYTDTPTRGGNPGDVLGGDLRFRIVVYDSCNNYKAVARTGFKVWWQGTWPNINYGNN